ncbi:MAG: hypothetical protein GXO89_14445 [Chlorobi bacterium]|nr:hypothetical protein [Chlorobiota bacterium]
MNKSEQKFQVYLTVLRFIVFKVTANLKRVYLDIDLENKKVILTAFYLVTPTELEIELFDDIRTNSEAHLPDLFVNGKTKLIEEYNNEDHEFVVFSVYEDINELKE